MRKLLAALAVLALPACSNDAPKPDTTTHKIASQNKELASRTVNYTALLEESFTLDSGEAVNAADIIAQLPEGVSLTIGASDFDTASGATIWTDVKLTAADNRNVGIAADEVKLWGLDTDAIAARISGSNLDQTVQLAERIEAKGLAALGLKELMFDFMTGYIEWIANTFETVIPEGELGDEQLADMRAAMDMLIDKYSFTTERIVAVRPQMRPWEINPIEPGSLEPDDPRAVLVFLQTPVAYYRAIGVEELVMSGTDYAMTIEQGGVKQDVTGSYGLVAYSGLRGGDLDHAVLTDLTLQQDVDMSEMFVDPDSSADGAPELAQRMNMDFTVQSSTYTGFKLDKALRYVAMGEWPSTDKTDLMSYGRFHMLGLNATLNEHSFFAIDEFIADLSEWHWFIPEKVELTLNGIRYDIDAFITMMQPTLEETGPDQWQSLQQTLDILRRYEALPFDFDTTYTWDWNPETGAFAYTNPTTHTSFGFANLELRGNLPNYEEGVAAIKADISAGSGKSGDPFDEHFKKSEFETLMEQRFALSGGLLVLDDRGGLEKLFALISEIGKLYPDELGPMAANSTPEALRSMAVSSVGLAAIQSGKELPQAENWGMAFSDWIKGGGEITLRFEPEEPFNQALVEKYPDPTPEEITRLLGITVVLEQE